MRHYQNPERGVAPVTAAVHALLKCRNPRALNCATGRKAPYNSYWCLQRSRGFNERFTSSVVTLQKVLCGYAWHNSLSLSAPFDRAHRIFSELKSAPLCTSSSPG